MLRWFPTIQVATACFSCSPPELNFSDPYFIFMYMHYNHCLAVKYIIITIIITQRLVVISYLNVGTQDVSPQICTNTLPSLPNTCTKPIGRRHATENFNRPHSLLHKFHIWTTSFLPGMRVFRAFSSVVRQTPGYNSQRRGTPRTLPKTGHAPHSPKDGACPALSQRQGTSRTLPNTVHAPHSPKVRRLKFMRLIQR
jgi:hypothetical protein